MSVETRVAWIGIAPKLLWSAVAVLALVMFRQPIYEALEGAADSGANVEVAGLKIQLPKRDIPPPPDSVRTILPHLDHALIENILSNYGGDNRVDTCYHAPDPDELGAKSVKSRLKALGLINFEKEDRSENGKPCEAGSKTTYTPLYDEVRKYLLDVLSTTRFSTH
jgi:hypothetical protein